IAFHAGVLGAVLVALGVLAWLLVSILIAGLPALDLDFLTSKTSTNAERAGFASAMRGSLVLMLITFSVAIPVGFAAAVYLEKLAGQDHGRAVRLRRRLDALRAGGARRAPLEAARIRLRLGWGRVSPRVVRVVDVNVSNLAAVPSIIYGLLGLAVYVTLVGIEKSLLAGALTLAVLVLPIIIISAREAIRAVPVSIEQGAMALGATRWQAVSRQVVPAAFPGMLTGTILAMSRAIGESAPLIVVGGLAFGTKLPSLNPLEAGDTPLFAMPLQIFFWAGDPRPEFRELAAAGIIVLLGMLVLMNALAIWLRNRFTRRW
ncbi:MAG: PstA family ABC transporter permease, partial [Actinomycetota bacterium]